MSESGAAGACCVSVLSVFHYLASGKVSKVTKVLSFPMEATDSGASVLVCMYAIIALLQTHSNSVLY